MQESGEDFGEQDEDTEIQNLSLYTERKADGIYRYRRRVPQNLVERVGKGYLYRNLGRTKKDVVGNWPEAHADVEAILDVSLSKISVPLSDCSAFAVSIVLEYRKHVF